MDDVNSNTIETDGEDSASDEPTETTMDLDQELSDSEITGAEAEPMKTPAKVKINYSHVHREYEVSVFFTRIMKILVK